MSWSVSASGTIPEVRGKLSEQFNMPLADKPAGLADDEERETVRRTHELIEQILATYDQGKKVSISACGSMGFANWDLKSGAYQNVNLSVSLQE